MSMLSKALQTERRMVSPFSVAANARIFAIPD
jgi:hypothetical protein